MDLLGLFKKLGHDLEEIRSRSLRNLLLKIEHGLVVDADLIHDKVLLAALLRWFSFPTVPMQAEVLGLLRRLASHGAAARLLADFGAVELMARLRPGLQAHLRAEVDAVVDFVLHVHVVSNDQSDTIVQPLGCLSRSAAEYGVNSSSHIDRPAGYFVSSEEENPMDAKKWGSAAVKCLKFSSFPWVTLTPSDKQVFASTERSLQCQQASLVHSSCDFLSDVMMRDFPAEIFLQRPNIAEGLLMLVSSACGREEMNDQELAVWRCLRSLCHNLSTRLKYHHDPDFFCTKTDLDGSTVSLSSSSGSAVSRDLSLGALSPRPSTLGQLDQRPRGDGRDGDLSSSSGGEGPGLPGSTTSRANEVVAGPEDLGVVDEWEAELSLELQIRQLNLPHFCLVLLGRCFTALRTGFTKDFFTVLEVMQVASALLIESLRPTVWQDDTMTGRGLASHLGSSLAVLADLLIHHYDAAAGREARGDHHYLAFVVLSLSLLHLLQALVPLDEAASILPEEVSSALLLLAVDVPLAHVSPEASTLASAFLERVGGEVQATMRRAVPVKRSMWSTCAFMRENVDQDSVKFLDLLETADRALPGLPYHLHLPFVDKFLSLCSTIHHLYDANVLAQHESRRLLLVLLSHPTDIVRARTYHHCLLAIKGPLGIHNVMRPFSMTCRLILFLLENHLLYEVFTFGIQDAYNEVAAAAWEIVVILYRSQMLMADSTWRVLIEATVPVVAVLQSYSCEDGELGNCILDLSAFELSEESQGDGHVLPPTEHLRASMRLLLTGKSTIRAVGCHQLFRHLVAEPDAAGKRPSDLEVVLAAASDIFLVRQPVLADAPVHCSGVIKNDAVKQVHAVFASNAVDMTMRKSAAEQLAIMMMDSRLHVVLRDLGTVEEVLTILHGVVKKDGEVLDTMCLPCLTLLRRLLYKDPSLRCELAHRSSVLLTLLRVALIFRFDVTMREELAVLITLLLLRKSRYNPSGVRICQHSRGRSSACLGSSWIESPAVQLLPV
uniref:rotatin-like n=1 Tax=Myxine glutinosa TaxID=7769 RepID=UPI00358FF599